jgi:hypothetical protein
MGELVGKRVVPALETNNIATQRFGNTHNHKKKKHLRASFVLKCCPCSLLLQESHGGCYRSSAFVL